MTKPELDVLFAKGLEVAPGTRAFRIEDYQTAINMLAAFTPECRIAAQQIHRELKRGACRCKHLIIPLLHGYTIVFCGSFWRIGNKRRIDVMFWMQSGNGGNDYVVEAAVEHRQIFRKICADIGAVPRDGDN